MFEVPTKKSTDNSSDSSPGTANSTIQSEINENNIDALIRNVLDQTKRTLPATTDTKETTEKFGMYVRNFLDQNKRRIRNATFVKELTVLPAGNLLEAIEASLCKEDNPLRLLVVLWHAYMSKKYLNINKHAYERKDILLRLSEDANYARALYTDLIRNIYRDWIKHMNNEQPIDEDIQYELVPELLTASTEWAKIYSHLGSAYSRLKLNFNRETFIGDPCFFEMNPYFTGDELDKPFPSTIKAIKQFCREANMKLKLQMITNITESLRQDIELHQISMIEKKKVDKIKPIDVDNLVSCLECCLLLANQDISYHLDILKDFYGEEQLSALQFGHFVASLEIADEILKTRNSEGKIQSRSSIARNHAVESSVIVHKNLDGFRIRMSSIRFNHTFNFSHCFRFRTLKWICMLDINWISIFSDQPLKNKYEFVVKLHGTDNVMLGVYQKPEKPERLKNFAESPYSACICLRNGRLYDRGNDQKKIILPQDKRIDLMRISVDNGVVSWWPMNATEPFATVNIWTPPIKPTANKQQTLPSPNKQLYFHAILSLGAEIQIV